MSDFIAANLHKKVDHIMDVFFGAGVASHPTIIEQINYLLFMRALSQNDDDLRKIGITDKDQLVFDGDLEKYRWDNLLTLNAEQLFIALEDCFRHIPESTTNKTVRLVFRNAHIKLFDKPTLRTVLHEIDAFAKLMDEGEHKGKRDIFGDTYEYLLSKLAQAGTSGQFRTPRHIIEFLVDVVAPKKGETIIDPAVGTAGFLVKAFEYLRREYTSPEQLSSGGAFDKLSSKEHTFLYEHTFSGFDSDEDMIKFGMMNLYLHGLQNARMIRQNTLTDTAGSRDKYDVILANPPFSGKIDRDSVAEELQMNTGATEVLFLRYMMRHLTDNGRAGVIVPEGVLFNASGGHTKIREMLLENGLWCVVSLPSGVFNPYAGVKTSILFFDKTRREKSEVLFSKVEHDGFSLSAQRRPIAKNDLPEILAGIKCYQNGGVLQLPDAHVVSYERIKETSDFNLSGDRYKIDEFVVNHSFRIAKLSEVTRKITDGSHNPPKASDEKNALPMLSSKNILANGIITFDDARYISPTGFEKENKRTDVSEGDVLMTIVGTIGRVAEVKVIEQPFTLQRSVSVIKPSSEIIPAYLTQILRSSPLQRQMQLLARGVAQKGIYLKDVAGLEIPLPPLEIQRKIVEEIENKQTAIDHARAIISTLERERAYFDPSTRAEKEGWPIVKLEDLLAIERGASPRPINKFMTSDEDAENWVKIGDTKHATKYITNVAEKVTKEGANKSRRVEIGDFILSNSMSFGRPYIMKITGYIHDGWLLLRNKDTSRLSADYLYEILSSGYVQRQFETAATGGVVRNLNSALVKNVSIPLPPIEIQKKMAAEFSEEQEIVESNKKLIDRYAKKIQSKLAEVWGE